MKIDCHQHYWDPSRGDYHWMPKDGILPKPWQPSDLAPHLSSHGIDKTVVVQAAATVAETDYMLSLADVTPSIGAVVGWVDFEDPSSLETLRRLKAHPKFRGVRPMIQDIPNPDWMLRDDVQWAYEALIELDLTFDALGFPIHIPRFQTLLARYPDLRVVLDHCMKPQIRDHGDASDDIQVWKDGMTRLAEETSAYCKLSALATEAADGWTHETLRLYAEHVIDAFGPDRTMWGSDWPVLLISGAEYGDWHRYSDAYASHLTEAQCARIFGGTAAEFYRITD